MQFTIHTTDVEKGQAVYSKPVLALYDWWVLGVSNRLIWQCPTPKMLDQFNRHVTDNHLDVGVGTGYYLDKCQFPDKAVRLGLLDLNANSLEVTARRVQRYEPQRFQGNVLAPLDVNWEPFDSISLNYLFHCLPGALPQKMRALDHLSPLLSEDGCIFGATLLQGGVQRNALARRLMAVYNKKGIFSNTADALPDLEEGLKRRFDEVAVTVEGCVALFWASSLRSKTS